MAPFPAVVSLSIPQSAVRYAETMRSARSRYGFPGSLIGDFLGFLDRRLGLRNCIVALTSDNRVAPIPEYILKRFPHADARRVSGKALLDYANDALAAKFGTPPRHSTLDRGYRQ